MPSSTASTRTYGANNRRKILRRLRQSSGRNCTATCCKGQVGARDKELELAAREAAVAAKEFELAAREVAIATKERRVNKDLRMRELAVAVQAQEVARERALAIVGTKIDPVDISAYLRNIELAIENAIATRNEMQDDGCNSDDKAERLLAAVPVSVDDSIQKFNAAEDPRHKMFALLNRTIEATKNPEQVVRDIMSKRHAFIPFEVRPHMPGAKVKDMWQWREFVGLQQLDNKSWTRFLWFDRCEFKSVLNATVWRDSNHKKYWFEHVKGMGDRLGIEV